MNTKTIKTLMTMFEGSELQTFKFQNEEFTLELTKTPPATMQPVSLVQSAPAQPVESPPAKAPEKVTLNAVKAPLVGIYYEAPGPDQAAFVSVGATVKKGQTICIVEAMKVMNEISAPSDGVVKEILVKNGDMVMFDQPLMVIE